MSVIERLTRIENRFLDWMRAPDAARAATDAPTGSIDALTGKKYCVLVTYKRDGSAVPSPLWFGARDGVLYTHTTGWKIKRIQNNPSVRVAACTFRGRPTSAPFEAKARVLDAPDEIARAEAAIAANYGLERRVYYRVLSGQEHSGAYVEVTPITV